MKFHHFLLVIHLLSASVWIGGHLLLLLRYVPESKKTANLQGVLNFRKKFEPIGMTALLLLIVTGITMSYDYNVTVGDWFSFATPIEKIVSAKLILIFITMALAVSFSKFLLPKLKPNDAPNFLLISFITAITLIAVSMLILGTYIR